VRRIASLAAALACAPAAALAAPATPPQGAIVTNGPVRAITVGGGRVYFGGDFTKVGSFVGSNMRLDWNSGELKPGFARTNGQVSDIVSDGSGGWYLGGGFDWVEGVTRTNLVHVKPDGSVDRSFNARVDGFVSALALDGDRLYVAGTLRKVDGRARTGIALVDASSGRLDTNFRYAGTRPVPEIALSGQQSGGERRLYAQSYSSFAGPGPVQAIDPFNGAALDDFHFPFEPKKVGALAVRGDMLYVGGGRGHFSGSEFGSAGSLVALDGSTGDLERSFEPGGGVIGGESSETHIEDIEVDGEQILVGGRFKAVGDHPSSGVARLDAVTGAADTSFEAGITGTVAEVALADGLVHTAVGDRVIALDSTGGETGLDVPEIDGPVDALATQSGILYAGGRFKLAGAFARKGLAAADAKTGRVVRGFRPAAGPAQHAQLALAHGRLYVGDYRGVRGPIAALSPGTGERLRGFNAPRTAAVYDFAIGRDVLYGAVGGARKVIAFDANSGKRKRSFKVRTEGYVADVEFVRGRVFLAGGWEPRGGNRSVVALMPGSGKLIQRFDPHVNGEVKALATDGGRLFLAGPFSRVSGARRPGIAAIGLGGGLDPRFRARGVSRKSSEMAVDGGRLYARDYAKNTLKVFRARNGKRVRGPSWTQFTAVEPTTTGAWIGAALGRGRSATWFLARR
jgi:hypothetical protein